MSTSWSKKLCQIFSIFFSPRCGISKVKCWKAMDGFSSVVFFTCSRWQAGQSRFLQTKHSFHFCRRWVSLGDSLDMVTLLEQITRRMFPHEYYKCVVAKRFVNEVVLPTTGKSWKAGPDVLRTQWEILLGGIWSAKRHPPSEICLGKTRVPLTPAPRSCRCKREELTKEAFVPLCRTPSRSFCELIA